MTTEHEKVLLEEMEHSELHRDEPLSAESGKRRGRSAVYSLRLPPETVEALDALARQRDVPPSVIARGFVLAGIEEANREDNAQSLIRQVEAGVRKLKRMMGQQVR